MVFNFYLSVTEIFFRVTLTRTFACVESKERNESGGEAAGEKRVGRDPDGKKRGHVYSGFSLDVGYFSHFLSTREFSSPSTLSPPLLRRQSLLPLANFSRANFAPIKLDFYKRAF